MPDIHIYNTFIFDCDGVILDSNKLKTKAFYQAALPYGEVAAQALADYHVRNGGISRYLKFEYFLQTIIGADINPTHLNQLLSAYAGYVQSGLLNCAVAPGLQELRQMLPNTRWLVASGSDQTELRDIFTQRNLSLLFDGGIFGSPDTKVDILARELANGNITLPATFLGDSRYDYEAASHAGLDFIFINGWSEWSNPDIVFKYQVQSIRALIETSQ
jgi:phosphoglycolate phosphatase-like HAD superfamily hydrolase